MAITLRTVTGSALTFDQLDTNFSSYFYSASYAGGTITLFTTGSDDTGSAVPAPASMSFTVPIVSQWTGSTGVSSIESQIQITGSLVNGSGSISAPNDKFSHGQGFSTIATGNVPPLPSPQITTWFLVSRLMKASVRAPRVPPL